MSESLVFRCVNCGGLNRVRVERLESGPKCGRCQLPLDLDAAPAEVDDERLERLIRSAPVPVLVDFWAPWCGPCQMVAPHLQALAAKHAGRLLVAKVNVDHHKRVAGQLGVQGIPTLALYRDGKLVKQQSGAMIGPQLEAFALG